MARKSALSLYGFDELIKKIEKAGGTIDSSVDACARNAANIQQEELKNQMHKKRVSSSLVNRMPLPEIKREGNEVTVRVGYRKGSYDPKNLSDGYKAVFINYGTPRISKREFVKAAKRKATPKIKKVQEETLHNILKDLES